MAGHTPNPNLEFNLNMDKIPLKTSNSLNPNDRLKSPPAPASRTFFNPCDRPNTALDFTAHHKATDALKLHYRPQTSAGVRPGSDGEASRAHHVSFTLPSGGGQPSRGRHLQRGNVRAVNSRELRAGCLHVGCDCVKLNGLQADCRRRECSAWHGNQNPKCARAECAASVYGNARHLQAIVDAAIVQRWQRRHPK